MKEGRGEDDLMRHGESWTVRLTGRLFEQQLHDAMILGFLNISRLKLAPSDQQRQGVHLVRGGVWVMTFFVSIYPFLLRFPTLHKGSFESLSVCDFKLIHVCFCHLPPYATERSIS